MLPVLYMDGRPGLEETFLLGTFPERETYCTNILQDLVTAKPDTNASTKFNFKMSLKNYISDQVSGF